MKKVLSILSILFLSACGILPWGARSAKAKLHNENFKTIIPFESKSSLQVVTVVIQGVELKFIWDTGAGVTVLTKEGAEKLNLTENGNMTIRDSRGNKKRTPLLIIDSLQLGDLVFENVLTAVIEYPKESAIKCIAYDGILGQNTIKLANWTVNYEKQILTVSDSSIIIGEEDLAIPFKHNNSPRISLELGNTVVNNILFDTGSNGLIDFPASIRKDLNDSLFEGEPSYVVDGTTEGVFGTSLDTNEIGYPKKLKLGGIELQKHSIEFESSGKGKVGQKIFRQWNRFSIDHQSQKIVFHGKRKPIELKPKFSIGFKKDSSTFTIGTMLMDHVNFSSGLNIGDTITSINGVELAEYSDFCDFFTWQTSDFNNLPDTVIAIDNHNRSYLLIKSLPDHFKNLIKN